MLLIKAHFALKFKTTVSIMHKMNYIIHIHIADRKQNRCVVEYLYDRTFIKIN